MVERFNFTKARLERVVCPEGKKLHYVYDEEVSGLAMYVTPAGTKKFLVYRKAKGVDSSAAFGSLLEFDRTEIKLRHSFYPVDKDKLEPFDVAVGAARNLDTTYHIKRPIMISAMSYGALGENANESMEREDAAGKERPVPG